jgi:transcription elongation GreA/GreB family factor
MSVAFRRDSDEEHLEPKFELPIPPGPNLVTERGRALIDARIAEFEAALAAAAADEEAAKKVRRDLRYWKTRRATAIVTAPPSDGSIGFGSVVEIELDGRHRTIAIVGGDEAEPPADRIAFTAPLARALIGAEADEMVAFAGREDAIRVVAVQS